MDPSPDEYRLVYQPNATAPVIDIPSGKLKTLAPYSYNGWVETESHAANVAMVHAGFCTGRLIMVGSRLAGKTPLGRQSDSTKLSTNGGTAFVVAVPKDHQHPDVNGRVEAIVLTARHNVAPNRSFLAYDPVQVYYCPEVHVDLDDFDHNRPEFFKGGRLYRCQILHSYFGTPTFNSTKTASHEITDDGVALAVIGPAVNEDTLLDVPMGPNKSLASTSASIGKSVLVPSLSIFQRDTDKKIAAIGYPGPEQRYVPQEEGYDFNQRLPKNPVKLGALKQYFGNGKLRVAGIGHLTAKSSLEKVFQNNGMDCIASTGGGMSGGPIVQLEDAPGLFCGLSVGSATTSNKMHLTDLMFAAYEEDPTDDSKINILANLFAHLKGSVKPKNVEGTKTDYDRRTAILMELDKAIKAFKKDTDGEFSVEELNYNFSLSVCGPTLALIYKDIAPYVDQTTLSVQQKAAFQSFCNWLETLSPGALNAQRIW